VIDRFHVVKALNEVLDQVRRSLRRKYPKEPIYKDLRWKLFKRLEHCNEQDQAVLQQALEKARELQEIYGFLYIKGRGPDGILNRNG